MEAYKLFRAHAYESPAVNDWIDLNFADVDTVRAFGPIAEMRGNFVHSNVSQIYRYKFVPDTEGAYRAVIMPIMEDGCMVDIAAFRLTTTHKKLDVWGTVTGAGRFLNRDAIYDKKRKEPLDVHETWWRWMVRGCKGVVPLKVSAIPELREAGDVVVESSSEALRLLYEAYLWGRDFEPSGPEWNAAKELGRKRIWVDDGSNERVAA